MNENSEKKFDQLLSSLKRKEFPLEKWMEEDESEIFDRIVGNQKRQKSILRWIAAAACLVFIVGFAGFAKLLEWHKRQDQLPQPIVAKTELPPQPVEIKQVESHELVKKAEPQQTVKKHRKTRKPAMTAATEKVQPTAPESKMPQTEAEERTNFRETDARRPEKDDPFISVDRQMSVIRQRGEQLSKEIAMYINDK